MKTVKRLALRVVDFLEITVPTLMFLVIFIVFLITIVSRYILRHPVPWTYEIIMTAFLWCAYFACGYAMRKDEHVVFAVVYDVLPDRYKKLCRLLSRALIGTALLISLWPCLDSLSRNTGFTGTLFIPFVYVFFPLIIMFVDIVARSIYGIIAELRGGSADAHVRAKNGEAAR